MIQLFHVYKSYFHDREVLVDLNLKIEKGEFCFLTGISGAGKTTLFRLLFCDEPATSGQVLIMGRNVSRMNRQAIAMMRRRIGVVFQDFKLMNDRTVFENIAVRLEVLGRPRGETVERVKRVLKDVGLLQCANMLPLQLSGGEQQRIAIARALVNEPLILLADEPTGNLDEETTADVLRLFFEANVRGTTIMLATHDRRLYENSGRRMLRLERGRIVMDSASPLVPKSSVDDVMRQQAVNVRLKRRPEDD